MGMIGLFAEVTPPQLADLLAEPEPAFEFFYSDEPEHQPVARLDVDKLWHGVHFLINGRAWECEGPIGRAILGGTEFGEDAGYGRPRYHGANTVRTIATDLRTRPRAELAREYDPEKFNAADIYPFNDCWNDQDGILDELLDVYDEMVAFYAAAAARGNAMLLGLG